MLPIAEIYEAIHDIPYVIMRVPKDWPNYKVGSDVDILTCDRDEIVEALRVFAENNSLIAVHSYGSSLNVHFDFMNLSGIELRFDLYKSMSYPWEKPVIEILHSPKSHFISACIDGKEAQRVEAQVPSKEDEAILRLLEYQAHPEKKQHLKWLKENL